MVLSLLNTGVYFKLAKGGYSSMTCSKCGGHCELFVPNSIFNVTVKGTTDSKLKQEERENIERFLQENVIADLYLCFGCFEIRVVDKTDYAKLENFLKEGGYKKVGESLTQEYIKMGSKPVNFLKTFSKMKKHTIINFKRVKTQIRGKSKNVKYVKGREGYMNATMQCEICKRVLMEDLGQWLQAEHLLSGLRYIICPDCINKN